LGKRNKAVLLASVALIALVLGGVWMVAADEVEDIAADGEDQSCRCMWTLRGRLANAWSVLSEEQRSELASEIQALIAEKFEEWGLDPLQLEDLPLGRFEGRGFMSKLTEEQRSELISEIQALKDAGATCEEIQELITRKFEEWGLEPPRFDGFPFGRYMRRGRFMCRGFMPTPTEEQ